MSTPNSSSGEEEKSERAEYNALLQSKGRSTTEKAFESNSSSSAPFLGNKDSLKPSTESLDFDEVESLIWRKHHLRRFFQDRGVWWTASRQTVAWRWFLVLLTGVLVALMGAFVQVVTGLLQEVKFKTAQDFIDSKRLAFAFFAFLGMSLLYSFGAGCLCLYEPAAAGSGIPEIKAYLNGVNLDQVVRLRVLYTKVLGMCLSVASGLPLGKEGPMIHAGSIIGAAVSQGNTITFGFDTSWTKFQDLRNDRSKRDFVTFGAAAGIAAAFKAPIGGILFTLEEGATYWSTALTFRAFFCALITVLSFTIIFNGFTITSTSNSGEFQFGSFDTFLGYRTYELVIFTIMGVMGGLIGALFNHINKKMTLFRIHRYKDNNYKRFLELLLITGGFAVISFLLPLMWIQCTPLPTDTGNWTPQEFQLLNKLVQFTCPNNQYNELASLYFVGADTAMQQLYHFKEINGTSYPTFGTGCLFLFFCPYFLFAAVTSGTFAPAGLFVPTLLSGAAFGRIVGHILNAAFPYYVADSGTYALIGAAAILGGMSRSTIAATVIILEACGNNGYLLPLMLTFAAARYTGNALNDSMYDMQIELKKMPFLEGNLRAAGLINYHPITEVMARPVITLKEINSVRAVYDMLTQTTHNGFPVVSDDGHLKGFILRKTLCGLLKLKAFSSPVANHSRVLRALGGDVEMKRQRTTSEKGKERSAASPDSTATHDVDNENDVPTSASDPEGEEAKDGEKHHSANGGGSGSGSGDDTEMITLTAGATVFHQTLEKNYPLYPVISEIELTLSELNSWLDIRPYMDGAPYSVNESSSVKRCYRFFRTMGLRHLVVVDAFHKVTGIITRNDVTHHRMQSHWVKERDHMSKFVNIDTIMEPARIPHNVSQDSMTDMDRGDSKHPVQLQSPSWTGVRSLLGTDGSLERSRAGSGAGAAAGAIQTLHNPSGSSGSISSDPSSTSSLVPSERTTDRSKAAKRQKSKEPKSYKSSI